MTFRTATLDLRSRRRVLLAGDVHGCFDKLKAALSEARWDPQFDSLVLLGDIVDRGPDSIGFLDWTSALGNHERIAQAVADGEADRDWIVDVGAEWLLSLEHQRQREIARTLMNAPVAAEVLTPGGWRIGLTHADCPPDWTSTFAALSDPDHPSHERTAHHCLWSRTTIEHLIEDAERTQGHPTYSCAVSGIDHVFHGHSVVVRPFCHGNRSWIDTGSGYDGGRLTVIDPDQWLDRIDERRIFD